VATIQTLKADWEEEKHPRGHGGKFTDGGHTTDRDSPMHERAASGGDLHERAKTSLQDHAFVQQHGDRLTRAGDETRARYPREEHYTDAVHAEAQQAIHAEAMRIHHEQDVIGDNPHLQRAADSERHFAGFRREDLETQHASVMTALARERPFALEMHQRDLDSQSRGFANRGAELTHRQALADADSQSRGFADREAEQSHRESEEAKAARADEDQAIAAGHVSAEPREIGDRYEAAINEHQRAAEAHADALDKAHHEAADALASLHGYGSDDHEKLTLEHARPSLAEEFGQSQTALHEAIGRDEHDSYERESHQRDLPVHPDEADLNPGERYQPYDNEHDNAALAHHTGLEYVQHPDDSEHDLTDEEHEHQAAAHEAWAQRAEAAYSEAIETRHAEFQRRAAAAQDALERLHEHQIAAHEGLRASSLAAAKAHSEATKALDKIDRDKLVHEHAFEHHERDEDGDIIDDKAREDYERAGSAADSMVEHAQNWIDERRFNASEALDPLKESTRSTRDAIKELARITGRAAKLPVKAKTKKSANRPGPESGASVWGMPAPARYKLTLTKLDFLSLVDAPAQETAAIRLVKRKDGADRMEATLHARVVKWTEGDNPLVYCWAFTCTDAAGQPYHDLQGDAITPDFIKAAEAFMVAGGAVDEMHHGEQRSRIAFAYPMDPDIAKAMLGDAAGAAVKQSGLMVAIRPTAEQLAKIKLGEYTGVSIAGAGIRELVKAAAAESGAKCATCDKYGDPDDSGNCKSCGKAMKSAPAASVSSAKATRRLGSKRRRPLRKQAVLTDIVDGHQHQIDLDDPADGWSEQLTTSYNTSEGAEAGHSHAWVYDDAGKITIAQDSGHTHTVDAVVPAGVIQQAKLNESGRRCPGCGEMCEEGCRFCPGCGCALDRRDAVPTGAVSDGNSSPAPAVIIVSARSPVAISPPSEGASTVKGITEEHQMADPNELAALKAENALLKNLATLTDAQRDHHNRLVAKGIKSDADAFLVLDKAARNTVLAEIEKANVEVYTSKSTGRVYRMSDDVEKIEAAKQTDAMLEMTKRAEDKERELDFTKRAGELIPGCFKGVKNNVPTRLIKAIRAEFKEPAELAEVEKALKQYEAAFAMLSKAGGYSTTDDATTDSPAKRFETAVNDFAKRNNLSYALAVAKGTESDPEIRRLYNEASLLAS
jgi:hypothetical protein